MKKRTKRIYGILLSMSMLLTLISVPVWAAEPVETEAGFEQEQEQQQKQPQEQKRIQEQKQTQEQEQKQEQEQPQEQKQTQGQKQMQEQKQPQEQEQKQKQKQTQEQKQIQQQEEVQAQTHEYTETCDTLTKSCVHVHTSECYPQTTGTGTVSGNDAMESEEAQPTACTHVCSEESSGINVENALRANGLPIVMAPNNRGDVELKQDTIENYRVQHPNGDSFYRLPSGNYRLGENITLNKNLVIGQIDSPFTVSLDLNGHKLEMGDDNTISLLYSSELNIKNAGQQEGEIINGSEYGIQINWDAKLRIYGGTIDSIITYYDSAEFYLYGGTIKRNIQFDENKRSIPNAVLYANGGIVEGKLYIWSRNGDKLTIRTEKSAASMTTFKGFVTNCKIEGGIFSGIVDGTCQIENSAKVTVDFDTKGVGSIPQQEVLRGQKAQDPGALVQDGYVFEGWYVSVNPNPKWDFSDSVTDNLKLEAHWNKVYQVTMLTNGGSIVPGKEIKSYTGGRSLTLPGASDITREGYTFAGWYEDSGFSGSPVTEISSTDTGDKTLYAEWSGNTYIVKLETNGGKIADGKDVTDYTCGTGAALPGGGDITRGGYTFAGWYEDSGFSGAPVTEISRTDTGDKTFYAKWKQNTVPVTPAQTEHNDANHDNTNHDNSGDTKESSGTAPVSYPALTFDTCGGSSIKAVRAWKGHMINLSGYRPTREGYEFSGWYADRNLTQPITGIRLDGNRTVYAGWIKQAEQTGENSKPKAVPAQLIAGDNAKTVRKDNGKSLIGAYEPGSSDTQKDTEDQSTEDQTIEDRGTEDQVTADQVTGDQRTEDTGDDQKSTVENNPADNNPAVNDSKSDDSVNLPSEDSSHSGGWIPVICICAGALVIGLGLHLGFRKWKKNR